MGLTVLQQKTVVFLHLVLRWQHPQHLTFWRYVETCRMMWILDMCRNSNFKICRLQIFHMPKLNFSWKDFADESDDICLDSPRKHPHSLVSSIWFHRLLSCHGCCEFVIFEFFWGMGLLYIGFQLIVSLVSASAQNPWGPLPDFALHFSSQAIMCQLQCLMCLLLPIKTLLSWMMVDDGRGGLPDSCICTTGDIYPKRKRTCKHVNCFQSCMYHGP